MGACVSTPDERPRATASTSKDSASSRSASQGHRLGNADAASDPAMQRELFLQGLEKRQSQQQQQKRASRNHSSSDGNMSNGVLDPADFN